MVASPGPEAAAAVAPTAHQSVARPTSTRSSNTQVGAVASGATGVFDEEKKTFNGAALDGGIGNGSPESEEDSFQFPVMSTSKSISLVATMTFAMILNVGAFLEFGDVLWN